MNIAIIVPVYNVENYLKNCIESLLNQTKKNYTIYLIDDGSTDSSGKICDKYCKDNKNIKVFHKKNGGLSDARNYGVSHSNEPFITFVDSDDTIREDYIEKLYYAIDKGNVDISIANYIPVKESVLSSKYNSNNFYIIENSRYLLKDALLGNKGSLSSCGKLFKRYLLESNPFPKGKLYEDMEIVYKILCSVSSVAYVNQDLYFYLTRENSIVQSRVTEKHKYGILSCIHMHELESSYSEDNLNKYIECRIVKQACGHLPNLVRYNDFEMFEDISKIIHKYLKGVIFGHIAPLKLKILAVSYYLKPKLGIKYAGFMFWLKKKINI